MRLWQLKLYPRGLAGIASKHCFCTWIAKDIFRWHSWCSSHYGGMVAYAGAHMLLANSDGLARVTQDFSMFPRDSWVAPKCFENCVHTPYHQEDISSSGNSMASQASFGTCIYMYDPSSWVYSGRAPAVLVLLTTPTAPSCSIWYTMYMQAGHLMHADSHIRLKKGCSWDV